MNRNFGDRAFQTILERLQAFARDGCGWIDEMFAGAKVWGRGELGRSAARRWIGSLGLHVRGKDNGIPVTDARFGAGLREIQFSGIVRPIERKAAHLLWRIL